MMGCRNRKKRHLLVGDLVPTNISGMGLADRDYMKPGFEGRVRREKRDIDDWRHKLANDVEERRRKKAQEATKPTPVAIDAKPPIMDSGVDDGERFPGVLESGIFASGDIPETDDDISLAASNGFAINRRATVEGYVLASKNGYTVDIAGVGGFHRIWMDDRLVKRAYSIEEAIDWIDRKVGKEPWNPW